MERQINGSCVMWPDGLLLCPRKSLTGAHHMNLIHTFRTYLCTIHFNILPSTTRFHEWSLPFRFPNTCHHFCVGATSCVKFSCLAFIIPIPVTFSEQKSYESYNSRLYSLCNTVTCPIPQFFTTSCSPAPKQNKPHTRRKPVIQLSLKWFWPCIVVIMWK